MRTICKGRDALYPVPLREGGVSKASEGRSRSKQGRGGWLLAQGCWLLVLVPSNTRWLGCDKSGRTLLAASCDAWLLSILSAVRSPC